MKLSEKRITEALRRRGYKMTHQRRAIIRTILSNQNHLTPAAIRESLTGASVGLITIYRTLEVLAELKLVCRLHVGGSPSYAVATPEHHHHLVCNACGRVVDFAGGEPTEIEKKLTRETGFKIDSHVIEFSGVCRECQEV